MKHAHDVLRERLHKAAGLTEPPKPKFNLLALEVSEWSREFERLMRNRLIMGAFRYGLLADKKLKGKKWDLIEPIRKKVELYEQTGNTEYLVDAANYCLLAFECDNHPNKHFKALDDHHDHCKRRRGDRRVPMQKDPEPLQYRWRRGYGGQLYKVKTKPTCKATSTS